MIKTVAFLWLLVSIFSVTYPSSVLGQDKLAQLSKGFTEVEDIGEESGIEKKTVPQYIESALVTLTGLVAIIALAVLVIGGFMYITSAGNDTQAQTAKKLILYAIVGLLIIGASFLIVNEVIKVFKA